MQDSLFLELEKLQTALRTTRAREERLRQQRDLLDYRAAEAITVEDRSIREQEAKEAATNSLLFEGPSEGLALNLDPYVQSALEGYLDSFQDFPLVPETTKSPPKIVASSSS